MKKNNAPKPLTKWDIIARFQDFNTEHNIRYGDYDSNNIIYAVIVYKQDNFTQEYTENERSYIIDNYSGKAFFGGMISNSIYGDCLDGIDLGVRLDVYNWQVERCYYSNKEGDEI